MLIINVMITNVMINKVVIINADNLLLNIKVLIYHLHRLNVHRYQPYAEYHTGINLHAQISSCIYIYATAAGNER